MKEIAILTANHSPLTVNFGAKVLALVFNVKLSKENSKVQVANSKKNAQKAIVIPHLMRNLSGFLHHFKLKLLFDIVPRLKRFRVGARNDS